MILSRLPVPIVYVPRPGRLSAFLLAQLRPLDIDFHTVRFILGRYGLSPASLPKNLPNARRNRNLVVPTTHGKKILKLYRSDWRASTIRFEHSILRRLAHLDSPAPRVATALDGTTWIRHQGDDYALFDFIEGKTFTSSFLLRSQRLSLMNTAGRTLAALHQALAGFIPDSHHHLGFDDYDGPRRRDVAWHAAKLQELAEKSRGLDPAEHRALGDRMIQQSNYVLDELSRLDEQLGRAELPRVIIHGDYGLHNLLFQETDRATPVDFELARLEWRLSDLVSCLSRLRFAGGDYDFESMSYFMHGYRQVYPISDDEWRCFPMVWQYYRLMGAVQYWKSFFETSGPARKLHSALDSVAQAVWAAEHPAEILAIQSP